MNFLKYLRDELVVAMMVVPALTFVGVIVVFTVQVIDKVL